MKHFLSLLILLSLTVFSQAAPQSELMIDVRTPAEFVAGHIAGAINIPLDQLQHRPEPLKRLNKDRPMVVYCHSGRRSALALSLLEQQGYKNVRDGGGMAALARTLRLCTPGVC